jgi:hypothetical protein
VFSKTGEIDNLTVSCGKVFWLCCVQVLRCRLMPIVRPANSQLATPSKVTHFSYLSIKPWFLTEEKLASVLIIPSSWSSPTVCNLPHHPLGVPPGANGLLVKNYYFCVCGEMQTDARDHFRRLICIAPLEMPLCPAKASAGSSAKLHM